MDIPAKSDYAVRAMLALAEPDLGRRDLPRTTSEFGGRRPHLATVEQLAERAGPAPQVPSRPSCVTCAGPGLVRTPAGRARRLHPGAAGQ